MSNRSFSRRAVLKSATIAAPTTAMTLIGTPAIASGTLQWKMITSWPKGAPGVGTTAQRLANRITDMSNGKLTVKLYGAGELVPPLEVFGAVGEGVAELGHTASFFWQGKAKASVFFTTVPFGLTSGEHVAWINQGGGQALWDKLYAPFNIKPFMAGNTGIQMGGWFKEELTSLKDLQGLKIRSAGLGGEIYTQMGATAVLLPPGEIYSSLRSGVVDAAEFLGPWSDRAFGFYKAAPYYYWPTFNKPNGSAECLVNMTAFEALSPDLQSIVRNACEAENAYALSESDWENARALASLIGEKKAQIREFPTDIMAKAKSLAPGILDQFVSEDPVAKEILASYRQAMTLSETWAKVGRQAFLTARDG
jgi:TRAP-type mannitol/chloroaromatic compound transport system substrate-binding protein